jgi:hypothetical protein
MASMLATREALLGARCRVGAGWSNVNEEGQRNENGARMRGERASLNLSHMVPQGG